MKCEEVYVEKFGKQKYLKKITYLCMKSYFYRGTCTTLCLLSNLHLHQRGRIQIETYKMNSKVSNICDNLKSK